LTTFAAKEHVIETSHDCWGSATSSGKTETRVEVIDEANRVLGGNGLDVRAERERPTT
jgi:hypothetical protein